MTSRMDVWVAENETTLLSTRPDALASSITSTSRIVAALPLRETTQIAPFGRMRVASSGSDRELGRGIGAQQDDVGLGLGPALGHIGRAIGQQRADGLVVDVDERHPHPRPDPELVDERRGVDPFHRGYRAIDMLLVYGPRSTDYDFGREPSADAAPLRAGHRPVADARRRTGPRARSRRPTRSSCGATRPATWRP